MSDTDSQPDTYDRPASAESWSFDDLTFVPTGEPGDGQRWSTWNAVQALCHGPEPRPDWIVTADAAIDTDLGALKSGKEADCFLIERAVPGDDAQASLLVVKRYREAERRLFHRNAGYVEGRKTRNSRDARAMAKQTKHGRSISAMEWAGAEWDALCRLWRLGVPVPYPVQIDGVEILMEFIEVDGEVAPRLAACRPDPDLLADLWRQLTESMAVMAADGLVHGDLSPYNILLAGDRLVIIDLPQMVDLIANPQGFEFLHRDCTNVTNWFVRRGLEVDAEKLFAELVAAAY